MITHDPQLETLVLLVKSPNGDDRRIFYVWLEQFANVEKVQHARLGVDADDLQQQDFSSFLDVP